MLRSARSPPRAPIATAARTRFRTPHRRWSTSSPGRTATPAGGRTPGAREASNPRTAADRRGPRSQPQDRAEDRQASSPGEDDLNDIAQPTPRERAVGPDVATPAHAVETTTAPPR